MTTDSKMMWTEAAVMPWVLSIHRAWTLCEHEEMTLLACSCTDRILVTVTPRIFMTSTQLMLAIYRPRFRGKQRLNVNFSLEKNHNHTLYAQTSSCANDSGNIQ